MYNDMANRETWTVNLYMQNQEGYYGYYKVLSTLIEKDELAQILRSDLTNLIPEGTPHVLHRLLLNALEIVDWDAVASSFYK